MNDTGQDRQRLDKWLWFARMARTRTAAADLVAGGHVRVNGQRVVQTARPVRPGDVLTIALARDVRLLRVLAIGERRGPFEQARLLYEDLVAASPAGETSS
ncbi:MAG: RNA-binding S4 domain-containing protein [Methylobacteriaceae bacterium]|nr:RNA-binding S4 domain-containing protein [Methylobacteriaceae bacterium]